MKKRKVISYERTDFLINRINNEIKEINYWYKEFRTEPRERVQEEIINLVTDINGYLTEYKSKMKGIVFFKKGD